MGYMKPEAWVPQGIDDLEPAAWDSLRECSRSVCVTAGAGAGKTEFLAQKAAYLLQTGLCRNPKRILAISFKRDAASNLEKRVQARCPKHAHRFVSLTFDGFTKGLLDRFNLALPVPYSPNRDYLLVNHYAREIGQFLTNHGYHGLNVGEFSSKIEQTSLPLSRDRESALRAYWRERYKAGELTFAMINRLVEWLLRDNHEIRRALRATYSFVFLDEFQDTTHPQFELLVTAFGGSKSILTAVGDRKQCIMGWAGAMEDSFHDFEQQFGARTIELLSNWRSHEELARIQHAIAELIDPETAASQARSTRAVDGDVSAIWTYSNEEEEAKGLAAWLAREIQGGINPEEFAVLVRNRADLVEAQLSDEFKTQGITLRNVARMVGEIAIQDVLEEPLTRLLLPFFRLGSTTTDAASWELAYQSLIFLHRVDGDDERTQRRLQEALQTFVRRLRPIMTRSQPSGSSVEAIYIEIVSFLSLALIRGISPSYSRQRDFNRACKGFMELLLESATSSASWSDCLDHFEGKGQIPLMTIHKSKGLEFHTILFHGLDNQTWWSLTRNRPEELRAFFVAFTRAKQRAFFTLCTRRGQTVAWIEQLLSTVAVKRIPGP